METRAGEQATKVTLALAGGLGVGLVGGYLGGSQATAPPAPQSVTQQSQRDFEERFDALESLLRQAIASERLTPAAATTPTEFLIQPSSPAPARVPASSDPAPLVALQEQVAELGRLVQSWDETVRGGLPPALPPSREQLLATGGSRHWPALEALWQVEQSEGAIRAADSVRFLDYAEVLARFGAPTSISFGDGQWSLWYRREATFAATGELLGPTSARFLFVDGYVSTVHLKA
jgi:hypothetical protein